MFDGTADFSSRIRRRSIIPLMLVLPLLFGGCAGIAAKKQAEETAAQVNAPPANYKADIVALMRTYLNDPTDVRGAFVTEPAIRTVDGQSRYAACLRYNGRKAGGQYAGSKDSVVVFRSGNLDRIVDNGREYCKDAAYVRFPELERITR
jgi:hypothetical protein